MRCRLSFSVVVVAVLTASAVQAHHSIAGQFDFAKTIRLSGAVAKVEWTNPHVYLFLDAKEASGFITTWKLETLPVAMLRKAGITKQMLMTSETVAMDIVPARDGTQNLGFILKITFPDGRHFQFSRDPNAGAVSTK